MHGAAVQRFALTPCRHCSGHAKQLLAFTVRSRTRVMAAIISDPGLADRPRLVDEADIQSEICRFLTIIADSQRYESLSQSR